MKLTSLVAMVAACLLGAFLLGGCGEEEMAINDRTVKGGWRTNIDDVSLTIIMEDDGYFEAYMKNRDGSDEDGGGLALLSGWAKLTDANGYRLQDDELVLNIDGKTLDTEPLTITSLTANAIALQMGDRDISMEFKRLKKKGD